MLGLRCGKLHEKSNTTKGVCVLLGIVGGFLLLNFEVFFLRRKDVEP